MIRDVTKEDAPELAALLNEISRAQYGDEDISATAVAEWFDLPELVAVVHEDESGRLTAYADLQRSADGVYAWVDLREHPEHPGTAAGILDRMEREAAGRPGTTLRTFPNEHDHSLRELLAARGYTEVRSHFQMLIELDGEVPAPAWPAGLEVSTMRAGEEEAVYEADMEAFADHWGFVREPFERWRVRMLRELFDPGLWWVAREGGEIAGICLCALHQSGDPTLGWVDTLGVRRPWRKRGLGTALLLEAFREFGRRGCTRVGLGVDAENTTGAVRLYERAGMHVERRSDTWEKRLS